MKKIFNIIYNSFKKKNFIVIVNKILSRISINKQKEALQWAKDNCSSFESFARNINQQIFEESQKFSIFLDKYAKKKLEGLNIDLGGGGFYQLLYFITRITKPKIIVETGVAAGYSSQTFLYAININGFGKLYSSDFPYFRIKNPEKYIGYIVDEKLKKNWNLLIEGDQFALPKFSKQINKIDIFHYDSDKSYIGRVSAIKKLKKNINDDTIIIFDDIQDNLFFRDILKKTNLKYKVFEFNNKFIGLIFKKL